MARNMFPIDEHNLGVVRNHISHQFATKSWWPAEGPRQAEEEFGQLRQDPAALAAWCAKWLDASQWRQMKIAVEREIPSRPVG